MASPTARSRASPSGSRSPTNHTSNAATPRTTAATRSRMRMLSAEPGASPSSESQHRGDAEQPGEEPVGHARVLDGAHRAHADSAGRNPWQTPVGPRVHEANVELRRDRESRRTPTRDGPLSAAWAATPPRGSAHTGWGRARRPRVAVLVGSGHEHPERDRGPGGRRGRARRRRGAPRPGGDGRGGRRDARRLRATCSCRPAPAPASRWPTSCPRCSTRPRRRSASSSPPRRSRCSTS